MRCGLRAAGSTTMVIPAKHYFEAACEKLSIDPTESKNTAAPARVQRAMAADASEFRKALRDPSSVLADLSLEECLKLMSNFYLVEKMEIPVSEFILYDCSCPRFRKKSKCKHGIACGILEGCLTVPLEKSLQCIKRKKQRGRPRKPTKAWERQSSSDEDRDE